MNNNITIDDITITRGPYISNDADQEDIVRYYADGVTEDGTKYQITYEFDKAEYDEVMEAYSADEGNLDFDKNVAKIEKMDEE